jgi:hypothetical protein
MSDPLPGEHLCIKHQGNTSHYAEHNCTLCKLQKRLVVTDAMVEQACEAAYETGSWGPGDWDECCEKDPEEADGHRQMVRLILNAAHK